MRQYVGAKHFSPNDKQYVRAELRIWPSKPRTKHLSPAPLFLALLSLLLFGCTKTEYRTVDNPAYIRVFNNLTYTVSLNNKEEPQPFFCLFIDPEFDESGKPIGGLVVSDFLDKRHPYASPGPAHAGVSTSKANPEYPGKELVPTAPVLNGFDLTNWAQIPSGTRRFVFMSRPISDIPFSQLRDEQQRQVYLDTTINLTEHEVYTLHLLQRDFKTKASMLHVRQENFHKQALSDTLTYVNFYNLSAKGFWQAPISEKPPVGASSNAFRYGIRDTMDIYLTHIAVDTNASNGQLIHTRIPEFSYQFAGSVLRSTETPKVAPYYSFPVFLREGNKIYANTWQFLQMAAPPISPINNTSFSEPPETFVFPGLQALESTYAFARFDHGQYNAGGTSLNSFMPGLLVNVHSGIYNPRSFGVVNSVEVVNGNIYLMTVQRRYPQPIY